MTKVSAAQWAATVDEGRYEAVRHELDERVVATVPAYAAVVRHEIDRFATTVRTDAIAGARGAGPGRWVRRIRFELMLFAEFTAGLAATFPLIGRFEGWGRVEIHAIVGALMLVSTVSWALHGWPVLRGQVLKVRRRQLEEAGLHALLAAAVGFGMLEISGRDGVQVGWVVAAVACTAVSVTILVLLLRVRVKPPPTEQEQHDQRLRDLETAQRDCKGRLFDAFERLPAADREALHGQQSAALDVLRRRGLEAGAAGDQRLPGLALLEQRASGLRSG